MFGWCLQGWQNRWFRRSPYNFSQIFYKKNHAENCEKCLFVLKLFMQIQNATSENEKIAFIVSNHLKFFKKCLFYFPDFSVPMNFFKILRLTPPKLIVKLQFHLNIFSINPQTTTRNVGQIIVFSSHLIGWEIFWSRGRYAALLRAVVALLASSSACTVVRRNYKTVIEQRWHCSVSARPARATVLKHDGRPRWKISACTLHDRVNKDLLAFRIRLILLEIYKWQKSLIKK